MTTILLSYRLGIDIGSRTVKVTVLNGSNVIVKAYGVYHEQKVYSAVVESLRTIQKKVGNMQCTVGLTGNSAPVMAHRTRLFYVNEETAVAYLVKQTREAADVTIEVGAAATYVHELASDHRWIVDAAINRGDYIEFLRNFLATDMAGLNRLAEQGSAHGRVTLNDGVLDADAIKDYLAEGMSEADLVAEIFQLMAQHLVQTIAPHSFKGRMAFVGVCFDQMPALREAYAQQLALTSEQVLTLPDAALCAASGAARLSSSQGFLTIEALIERLELHAAAEGDLIGLHFEPMELNIQRAGILSLPDRKALPKRLDKWRERLVTFFPLG